MESEDLEDEFILEEEEFLLKEEPKTSLIQFLIFGFIDISLIILFILSCTQVICESYLCIFGIFGFPILLLISIGISIAINVQIRKKRESPKQILKK